MSTDAMLLRKDDRVPFPAHFVVGSRITKTEQRHFVAAHAIVWLKLHHMKMKSGTKPGAIMIDIDDTLVDEWEGLRYGFESMNAMYNQLSLLFPVHVVTARPESEHANVMKMLHKRGVNVQVDRLHMLPDEDYDHRDHDKRERLVERFKAGKCVEITKLHGSVVARFGDRLWDVAPLELIRSDRRAVLDHVETKHCYIFLHNGCLCAKLPGKP